VKNRFVRIGIPLLVSLVMAVASERKSRVRIAGLLLIRLTPCISKF